METIKEIVAEMRKRSDEVYAGQSGFPECWKDQMDYDEIIELADRIEAAHKREIADALDTGAFVAEAQNRKVGVSKMDTTTKGDLGVGNAAKIREVLENITLHFCKNCPNNGPDGCELSEAEGRFEFLCHKLKQARAALSALSEPIGNTAKMREALREADTVLSGIGYDAESPIRSLISAALSEPPRDCDIYNGTGEALRRYGFPTKSKPWTEDDWLKFVDWLFAEAKGSAK